MRRRALVLSRRLRAGLEALGNGLHLDVRRRQPAASGRDAGMGHLFRSLSGDRSGASSPWRCLALLAKLSGSPYLGRCHLPIRISEKTPAPPGSRVFLFGLHGRLLSAGDRRSFPQSWYPARLWPLLWYSQDTALIRALPTAQRRVAVPEAASGRPAASSLMVVQAGGRDSQARLLSKKEKRRGGAGAYGIDVTLSALNRMGTDTA